jgi:hypothetical protein
MTLQQVVKAKVSIGVFEIKLHVFLTSSLDRCEWSIYSDKISKV